MECNMSSTADSAIETGLLTKSYNSGIPTNNARRLIPITILAGRGLIFDITDVVLLREMYHICGVLSGILPKFPQQNQFLGLPLELMPEEVKYIVEELKIGYLVDDYTAHQLSYISFDEDDKEELQEALHTSHIQLNVEHKVITLNRRREALQKKAAGKGQKKKKDKVKEKKDIESSNIETENEKVITGATDHASDIAAVEREFAEHGFADIKVTAEEAALIRSIPKTAGQNYEIETSTLHDQYRFLLPAYKFYQNQYIPEEGHKSLSPPQTIQPDPAGYEAFKYFHSQKGYNGEDGGANKVNFYLTPGLRFGGQYVSYPGDPLRFHSHHIVTGKEYDQKFKIMDIIGGGRLGTTVKKTWFVGALDREEDQYHGFCVEWSAFG